MSYLQDWKIPSIMTYRISLPVSVIKAAGVIVFILLTALGAFIRMPLPFTPVPITMQTFFVLLSGALLGRKFGCLSQTGYIILGVLGLPIFAGAGSGISCLFGPSGGYLLGFVAASFLLGNFLEANKSFGMILCIFLIAALSIDFLGTLWLMVILKISLIKAIFMGTAPFILGDAIKLISAAVIYDKLKFKF